jgi:3-oxoacyl-[acyl-carrier protein] reductase
VKHALVTGGTGAIGRAICRELARAGHHVFVHAHTRIAMAEEIAATIRAEGGCAEPVSFDIADADATLAVITQLLAQGPIQILVNNAGVMAWSMSC